MRHDVILQHNPNPNVGVAGHVTALDQSNFRIQNQRFYTTDDRQADGR